MNELDNNIIEEVTEAAVAAPRKKRRGWLISAIAVPVLAAAAVAIYLLFTFVGGQLIPRNEEAVDLQGTALESVEPLLRLNAPKSIDLRGSGISMNDYNTLRAAFPDCEIHWDVPVAGETWYNGSTELTLSSFSDADRFALRDYFPALISLDLRSAEISAEVFNAACGALPNTHILWSVPLSGGRFDCTAESISLTSFSEDDIALLDYFEDLRSIDASGCTDYEALDALSAAYPDIALMWGIKVGNTDYAPGETVLDLESCGAGIDEITEKLPLFRSAEKVLLGSMDMDNETFLQLKETYPDITFVKNIKVCGKTFRSTDTYIGFSQHIIDLDEIREAGPLFYNVEKIDLDGIVLKPSTAIGLREAYENTFIRCDIAFLGKNYPSDITELDLSGTKIEDLDELENSLAAFGKLETVDMSDCGYSDEEMAEFRDRFEDILIVWTVRFSVYELRTDIKYFCASDVPGRIAPKLTSAELEPLKYCTELEALDLGHMYYSDLSFLEYMPKLTHLILVEALFNDISPIADLENLYYLEIFNNKIDDISPLLELKNLRHLNIGFTQGYDTSVLKEFADLGLERFWFPGNSLTDEEMAEIEEALEGTECYMPHWDNAGSTGGGWREHDAYFEMRDLFGMNYMPGGTGMGDNT